MPKHGNRHWLTGLLGGRSEVTETKHISYQQLKVMAPHCCKTIRWMSSAPVHTYPAIYQSRTGFELRHSKKKRWHCHNRFPYSPCARINGVEGWEYYIENVDQACSNQLFCCVRKPIHQHPSERHRILTRLPQAIKTTNPEEQEGAK